MKERKRHDPPVDPHRSPDHVSRCAPFHCFLRPDPSSFILGPYRLLSHDHRNVSNCHHSHPGRHPTLHLCRISPLRKQGAQEVDRVDRRLPGLVAGGTIHHRSHHLLRLHCPDRCYRSHHHCLGRHPPSCFAAGKISGKIFSRVSDQ